MRTHPGYPELVAGAKAAISDREATFVDMVRGGAPPAPARRRVAQTSWANAPLPIHPALMHARTAHARRAPPTAPPPPAPNTTQDPPEHTRLRALFEPFFSPAAVEAARPFIQRTVDELARARLR